MSKNMKKPDYFGQAYRYTRALSRWIKAGRPIRDKKEIKNIFENQCQECEAFDAKHFTCVHCGCRVNLSLTAPLNKIAMQTEACPLGKW